MSLERLGRAVLELVTDGSGLTSGLASAGNSVGDFEKKVEGTQGGLANFGKWVAGAFTVTAIVGAVKSMTDFAGTLTDLSGKTGISTTGLQKLGGALSQSGVSMEAAAKASAELGARLASGDKGLAGLVGKLGLNLQDLRMMRPEDQFFKLADAVGNIQNKGEQLLASKTLFGKGGVDLLPALTGNLAEAAAEFENLGLVIDEQTVAAADDFGDKLGLMGTQLMAVTAKIVGPLLPALSGLMTVLGQIANVVGQVTGFFVDWIMRGLTAAYSAVAKFLALIAEAVTKIPFLGEKLGFAATAAEWLTASAAAADAQLVKMFTPIEAVGTVAQATAGKMLGLGDDSEKTTKKIAKHWSEMSMEAFKPASDRISDDILKMGNALAEFDAAAARSKMQIVGDIAPTMEEEFENMALKLEEFDQRSKSSLDRFMESVIQTTFNTAAHFDELGFTTAAVFTRMGGVIADWVMNYDKYVDAAVGSTQLIGRTMTGFVTLAGGIFGALGKKYKAFAIAEAIIATYLSIAKTLATTPWPFNLVLAAGAAAAGFANVMAIKNSDTPEFAEGGIVTRPLMGLLGEAGTEAVIPLDRLGSLIGGGRETVIHVHTNLDGREVARTVMRHMPHELSLVGLV